MGFFVPDHCIKMSTMMSPVAKHNMLFLANEHEEVVVFRLSHPSDILVKLHKSILIESSVVFRDMFDGDITNNEPLEPILIDDQTSFNLYEGFMAFAGALYETIPLERVTSERDWINPLSHIIRSHYFADKYQVDWITDRCRKKAKESIKYLTSPYVSITPDCLEFLLRLNRSWSLDMMEDIKKANPEKDTRHIVSFFYLAREREMDEFMAKLVQYCCGLEMDQRWPFELSASVFRELQCISRRQKLDLLRSHPFNMLRFNSIL